MKTQYKLFIEIANLIVEKVKQYLSESGSLDEETAQEIVEAVNGSAHLRQALTKIRDLANRDTDESMLAVSTRNNLMGHIANFALKGIEP